MEVDKNEYKCMGAEVFTYFDGQVIKEILSNSKIDLIPPKSSTVFGM